jgi:hypothetical protein
VTGQTQNSRLAELFAEAAKEASSGFHEAAVDWMEEATAELARQREAISTMAWWLVQAQTGFGMQDARGIEDILSGTRRRLEAEA